MSANPNPTAYDFGDILAERLGGKWTQTHRQPIDFGDDNTLLRVFHNGNIGAVILDLGAGDYSLFREDRDGDAIKACRALLDFWRRTDAGSEELQLALDLASKATL